MKVPAITTYMVNNRRLKSADSGNVQRHDNISQTNITDLKGIPYTYPVSFGLANSSKLKTLFSYGLPCMYSGVTMIDPKILSKFQKNQTFSQPALQFIKAVEPYRESIIGMEGKVLEIIEERAKIHPDKSIREILQEVEPVFKRRLRKRQAPVFKDLTELSHQLTPLQQTQFKLLMLETEKKLNDKPVVIPFSSYEFKYKLVKIKDDIAKTDNGKAKRVMNKLIKESKRLANSTNANTIENQKKVIDFLNIILKKSILKNYEPLKNLMEMSHSRLTKEEIIVPFSRKTFIYDLMKILENTKSSQIQEKFLQTASKLPTSQQSLSAFILKISNEQPEKIGHRIVWPYLASIEHIHPRSFGGQNELKNYGGATTKMNSDRKNIDFVTQMKLVPETRVNCQKYVDRLIELYKQGIFEKINLSPKYIEDFAKAIKAESKGALSLDISKMYD